MEGITQNVENTVQQGQQSGTQQQEETQQQEKLFTQAQLDEKIAKRLERERKKYPSEEELTAFQKWKESQQTEKQKYDSVKEERNTFQQQLHQTQKEMEQLKRERYLLQKGISVEDVDYYAFKISKTMKEEEDFETAAELFLKEKVKQNKTTFVSFGKQSDSGAKAMSLGDEINKKLRGEL